MNWSDSCSSQNGAEVKVAPSHLAAFRWGAEWCGVCPGTCPKAMRSAWEKFPSCAPLSPSWWLQHQQGIELVTRAQRNGTSPFHDGGGSGPGTGEDHASVPSQNVVWPNVVWPNVVVAAVSWLVWFLELIIKNNEIKRTQHFSV